MISTPDGHKKQRALKGYYTFKRTLFPEKHNETQIVP